MRVSPPPLSLPARVDGNGHGAILGVAEGNAPRLTTRRGQLAVDRAGIGTLGEECLLLGILYAALGAFTFALNNVAMRRGVVTGSVLQGMALTVPIGGLSFLVMTIAFGELGQLVMFPTAAFAWLACQGVVHFVIGRYCNYKSNQLMGVNLTAPVVQLQVPFAMLLAVIALHEKFTALQAIGSALMLGGSFITQGNAGRGTKQAPAPEAKPKPTFKPRVLRGYSFALGAAICYGSSPLMA